MQIYSFSPFGYEGSLVTVEVDLRRGIPAVDVVGLADGAVKESRERMQAAVRNSGFAFPLERILISLSPADVRKEGAGFDLPIALGVLCAQAAGGGASDGHGGGCEPPAAAGRPDGGSRQDVPVLVMGELDLSGNIRPVRGVHAAASTAAASGIMRCIVPAANAEEAREVPGMRVYGADALTDAFSALGDASAFSARGGGSAARTDAAPPGCIEIHHVLFPSVAEDGEFGDIVGQKALVRALQLAAAGGHNLIAVGAPGCGKTMALQKFPALLPVLTPEEAQPVTRILSLAGLLPPSEPLVRIPPFRMPHQTASIEGMCGGGPQCRPGEISLAHNGVLFLDEAAEFKTSVLQMLRVPMESGSVTLCRAGRSTVFPANFQLLMAANPCPCGNYGSEAKLCLCSARSIELYWKKFSAPLLDRIDIRVSVENENGAGRRSDSHGFRSSAEAGAFLERRDCRLTTAALREEVARAVFMQRTRQGKRNAKLSAGEVAEHCALYGAAEQALDAAVGRYGLSPRAVSSCRKVARTAADMAGRTDISAADIREAVFFRQSFCNLMDL